MLIEAFFKVKACIESCCTTEQLESCRKMIVLFNIKYCDTPLVKALYRHYEMKMLYLCGNS